jgi:hypothetical protein
VAEVRCVYREVKILKETAAAANEESAQAAIISYDKKPGIQAIATTVPDLPPELDAHATFGRDHEYRHGGTVSLLAGIDLVTGKVHDPYNCERYYGGGCFRRTWWRWGQRDFVHLEAALLL